MSVVEFQIVPVCDGYEIRAEGYVIEHVKP